MRRCISRSLVCGSSPAAPPSGLAAGSHATQQRMQGSIGGRRTRPGFAAPQGKSPRVRQGNAQDIPQRIPGTTKLRYTNQKGRTFTFSIPVTQLTHPPVNRRGASVGGWQEIDTSFSDVGDLAEDMPTELAERLAAVAVRSGGNTIRGDDEEGGGVVAEVDATQLQQLHESFVQLCKDYVLMDTTGMKTSMTYGELNSGPDYEHYDRKTRRRRHWIALRHGFEDVRELLWPTEAAREMQQQQQQQQGARRMEVDVDAEQNVQEDGQATPPAPLLSLPAMMEALSWAEAASTFAVRTHRPYDAAPAAEFATIDLSREVRVVAECIAAAGPSGLQLLLGAASSRHAGSRDSTEDKEAQRVSGDRLIAFAALCANHNVPLSTAFASPAPSGASSGVDAIAFTENSPVTNTTTTTAVAVHGWLAALPPLTRVKDALRAMAVLQSIEAAGDAQPSPVAAPLLRFSNADGGVVNAGLLRAVCQLASPNLFPHAAALENVDEEELCVLMRFVAELQEQNAAFLRDGTDSRSLSQQQQQGQHPQGGEGVARGDAVSGKDNSGLGKYTAARQTLQHLTQLALARCRQLLYKTEGPRASLMSGDDENIPLVELQAFADHNHPQVRVHGKIGEANAQGLRYATLQSPASATLAELLTRIEEANSRLASSTHTLRADLLQHIVHKAALGKARLTLSEVARALPQLAELMRQTSEQQVRTKYDRLFAAMSTSIGVGLQQTQKPGTVLNLLEGLAQCHYAPSSYKALEMVTLRLLMRGAFSLDEAARALLALLRVVGPHAVSQSVQQAVAMRIVAEVEKAAEDNNTRGGDFKSENNLETAATVSAVLSVLRALRFSLYPAFQSLMLLVASSPLMQTTQTWSAEAHVRYAVLLTAAAGRLAASESADDAAVVASLTEKARSELQIGLSASPNNNTEGGALCYDTASVSLPIGRDEDGYQECLVTCAALQMETAPPALTAWAHASERSTQPAQRCHALCTPLLAVGTLEAMETLRLVPSAWYKRYDAYLTTALEDILHRQTQRASESLLLEDDVQTAERTLYLACASPAARAAAAAVLEREVERLDTALTTGADNSSRLRSSGDVGGTTASLSASEAAAVGAAAQQPIFTFQQNALNRQAEVAALEEQLLRHCVALKQQQERPTSAEETSAEAA